MLKWETVDIKSGMLFKNEMVSTFEVYTDKSYVYFNRKHYNIIDIVYSDNETAIYKAECIRHTGHRHIKYETTFVVTPEAVGYAESLLVEI